MWMTKLKTCAFLLLTTGAGVGLLAQALPPNPVVVTEAKSKPANSVEMARTEAKLTKLRQLIKPQPGEHISNMARIAWEHDPWEAAVKAAKEGKPVLAYGEGAAGVPGGY